MHNLKIICLGIWLASGFGALAQTNTVVVELYTSQGCNSCPPADKYLGDLITQKGVIGLALHVDYWDYIGWKDAFAKKAFTARQKAYARASGRSMVYTPQVIIGGVEHTVGSDKAEISRLIKAHLATAPLVEITDHRMGGEVLVELKNLSAPIGSMAVQLVKYDAGQTINIGRGENAGKTIAYHNIVTDWKLIRGWTGKNTIRLKLRIKPNENAVLIVQNAPNGAIVAAKKLN